MTWKFHLQANDQRRLLSRVLQILDTQGVRIHTFSGETDITGTDVLLVISAEENKAYRVEALLHRLPDVLAVSKLSLP